MKKLEGIRGILFDYGGTLDTDARHWAHVLWDGYCKAGVPITEQQFREAYVYGERALARTPVILPEDNFLTLLQKKVDLEMMALLETGAWIADKKMVEDKSRIVAQFGYDYAQRTTSKSREVLETLCKYYPMVMVSNFYGNLQAILQDYGLERFFHDVVESAVVGVRKPHPDIFRLGVEALGLPANEVLVVGDSYDKDILPAMEAGCRTVWFKGEGWTQRLEDESVADAVITRLDELVRMLL